MEFWRQLKLIMWKNAIGRKRHKFRLIVELIWPLLLFLILAWIRTRGLINDVDECHFDEKPLPSTGFFPFIHSYVCTQNDYCYKDDISAKTVLPVINDETISRLMDYIANIDDKPLTPRTYDNFYMNDLFVKGEKAQEEFTLKNLLKEPNDLHNAFHAQNINLDKILINDLLNENLNYDSILSSLVFGQKELNCSQNKISQLCLLDQEKIRQIRNIIDKKWTSNMNKTLVETYIKQNIKDKSVLLDYDQNDNSNLIKLNSTVEIYAAIYKFLCGKDFSFRKKTKGIELIDLVSLEEDVTDRYATEECNEIFRNFKKDPLLADLWGYFHKFFIGRILYVPDIPVVRRIMSRVVAPFTKFTDALESFIQLMIKFNGMKNKEKIKHFDNLPNDDLSNLARKIITLSANNENISFISFLKCSEKKKFMAYNDSKVAERDGMDLMESGRLWAIVEFDIQEDKLPPLTTYTIRVNPDTIKDTKKLRPDIEIPGYGKEGVQFFKSGFAYIQDLIDHSIIYEKTNFTDTPGTILHQLPYPCYIDDFFLVGISLNFPLFLILSWIYTTAMIVKCIVLEKELRLKETMKVMGLGNGIHWIGWFIDSVIPMIITITILTIVLHYGNILKLSDPSVTFVFILTYGLATITQAFLISTFFDQANIAAASAAIIHFFLYIPYAIIEPRFSEWSTTTKTLMSLISNVALGIGAAYMTKQEQAAVGQQWSNLNKSPIYGDNFNMECVIFMLLFDAFIYMVFTWYIENVFPGAYGIPQPWYFCFTKTYWMGTSPNIELTSAQLRKVMSDKNRESEPRLQPGVQIINMSKIYPNGKTAVDNISVTFYEGHITSFLGHNGAGKTTTISILTGLLPPTSGTAVINGYDIRVSMYQIQRSLGYCPQHNVLFSRLTVKEHLWFYGMLRGGKTQNELRAEIREMLLDLDIPEKKDAFSSDLSGGMQRKLSIAVAFIGGSKTVILDEPTSGVDPFSRRSIWELLIKYKKDKTLILTTHYMDEADLLGDRIAIISQGKIVCVGSSIFLKSKFGKGYKLMIETEFISPKKDNNESELEEDIAALNLLKNITKFVKSEIPNAEMADFIGREIYYNIPTHSVPMLSQLCSNLDSEMRKLHISSYGITNSSLEEVFLALASDYEIESYKTKGFCCCKKRIPIKEKTQHQPSSLIFKSEQSKDQMFKKHSNLYKQFRALHVKRFLHDRRNLNALFSVLVMPIFLIFAAHLILKLLPQRSSRPGVELTPWRYPTPLVFFVSSENASSNYLKEITGPIGLGTRCNDPEKNENICSEPLGTIRYPLNYNISQVEECSCSTGAQACPEIIDDSAIPSMTLASKDELFALKTEDISYWILNTFPKYIYNRLGGFTLNSDLITQNVDLKKIKLSDPKQNSVLKIIQDAVSDNPSGTKNNIKVWFDINNYMSSAVNMNAIHNIVLRALLDKENSSQHGIKTINHPFDFSSKSKHHIKTAENSDRIMVVMAVLLSFSVIVSSFIIYAVEEKHSQSKHLQIISGTNKFIYWFEAFIWDMTLFFIPVILCILVFVMFNQKAFISKVGLPGSICLLMAYGWSSIPFMYAASFLFDVASTGFVAMGCLNILLSIVPTTSTFILSRLGKELQDIGKLLENIFLLFPPYCLGNGLQEMMNYELMSNFEKNLGVSNVNGVFDWDYIGKPLFALFSIGIIFFALLFFLEFKIHQYLFIPRKFVPKELDDEEEDVAAERRRIQNNPNLNELLVINGLVKIYPRKKSPSVKPLYLGLQKRECFGLLGLNGAGKTTTFKMLTGEISPSYGTATIQGYSITKDKSKARTLIGYCPQFDALDPLLTPHEHLIFYGRLRNIPSDILQNKVSSLITRMALEPYRNRCVKTLSGGNKRKLSTAIALIGSPALVFLDEPTTGMDPKAKRFLWDCIQDIVKNEACVVLTTHSMEECQVLCTRLTIMVDGSFACLGSSQQLKDKYASGYIIQIKCPLDKIDKSKSYMVANLPGAKLMEAHLNLIRYEVKGEKVSQLFFIMETAKDKNIISDYSLSQPTLEEVFLRFATNQNQVKRYISKIPLYKKIFSSKR